MDLHPFATRGILWGTQFMGLQSGGHLGIYEVLSPLGTGGMGEVYRARDTRLKREVALKVLPDAMAHDRERMARLEREAQLLAALNHPNIASIYGLEESNSSRALIMELVEGPTLADRIARGPIPLAEALSLALQIADGLAYAHDKGVIHRDLKPANIKTSSDGHVKILDFGLAKAMSAEPSAASPDALTQPMTTSPGIVMGTVAYMSPEQARGQEVDRRTDIWSFGVVVYEMLTGSRPFSGSSVYDTLAAVINDPPDLERVPPQMRRLLAACLQKDPRKRLRDLGDLSLLTGIALDQPAASSTAHIIPAAPSPTRLRRALPWAAALLCALAGTFAVAYFRAGPAPQQTIRSLIAAPEGNKFAFTGFSGAPVLSPDGTRLVFPAQDASGQESLWMRPLNSLTATRIDGTVGASYPFWSPDSRHIAFFQDGKLKRIDLDGGPASLLCDAPDARGGTWGRGNRILFASQALNQLEEVSASGGTPSPVFLRKPSGAMFSNRWPEFLPDGKHFLYLSGNLPEAGTPKLGIFIGKIGSNEAKFLLQADSAALYAPSGYLLFLRADTLMAQRFDPDKQKLEGEALPVAQHIASPALFREGLFGISQTGLLIYATEDTFVGGQMTWFDAKGKQLAEVGPPGAFDISLSPDGKQVAYVLQKRSGTKNDNIWLADLQRGVQTRFTFGPTDSKLAVWSPDGTRVAYYSAHANGDGLWVQSASGTGAAKLLFQSAAEEYPSDWSRDGRYIALTSSQPNSQDPPYGIWILPLFGDRKPFPYLPSSANKSDAVFSPDGRWLAYASDESGKLEVYLSPFPGGGGKWQVSQDGGDQPEWNRQGDALYYLGPGGKMMEASVRESAPTVVIGAPRQLFQVARPATSLGARSYCIAPDGKRFLVARELRSTPSPLTLVANWPAGLKK